jgi:hypothetical protein
MMISRKVRNQVPAVIRSLVFVSERCTSGNEKWRSENRRCGCAVGHPPRDLTVVDLLLHREIANRCLMMTMTTTMITLTRPSTLRRR